MRKDFNKKFKKKYKKENYSNHNKNNDKGIFCISSSKKLPGYESASQ